MFGLERLQVDRPGTSRRHAGVFALWAVTTRVDCAFVGAGAVASEYLDGIEGTNLRLAAVCDTDRERATALAAAAPGDPAVYTAVDALLAAESAPLVINLTSHAAHAPVTETALAADRHVFSEKPLALAPERAAALVETARDRGVALGCAPLTPRCDAQRHARGLLADGRLGRVRLATATANVGRVDEWHDRPGSFLDVGPLYDGAVYPLSLLVAWFGPVARVRSADAVDAWPGEQSPRTPHVEATLEFADGPGRNRMRVRVWGSVLGDAARLDHPIRSFVGVALARIVDSPVESEARAEDEGSALLTFRWSGDPPETGR